MSEKYLDLILDIKKNTEYTENIARCLETKELNFQRDINYFNNSINITGFVDLYHYKILTKNYDSLIKFYNKTSERDFLVSCNIDYNIFILKLFKNYKIKFTKVGDQIMYINNNNSFVKEFLKKLDFDIIETDKNLNFYLNMKSLSIPKKIDFNARPDVLVNKILFSKENSSNFYRIHKDTPYFEENFNRIKQGNKMLKFSYIQTTLKSKYILLLSLIDVNSKYNLPSNYIHKIIENLNFHNYIETFNYHYYEIICKTKKLKNFQTNSFYSIEEAVSHMIDLDLIDIKAILIKHTGKYNICYENSENISFVKNIERNKELVISELEKNTSEDYMYSKYSLEDLINIQIFDDKPYLENSEQRLELPYNLFINKGVNIYNLSGNILNFKDKDYPYFDRSSFEIKQDISAELIEKIDNYYSPIVNLNGNEIMFLEDFYIPEDVDSFEEGFQLALNKGYLISDQGIIKYIINGEIEEEDILFPDWFSSKTYEEYQFMKKFFKEIKYI